MNSSKWQRKLYKKLRKKYPGARFEHKIRTKKGIKRVDIYLPEIKTAVECDGKYWHSSAVAKIRDSRKSRSIEDVGIKVVRIREGEQWK